MVNLIFLSQLVLWLLTGARENATFLERLVFVVVRISTLRSLRRL